MEFPLRTGNWTVLHFPADGRAPILCPHQVPRAEAEESADFYNGGTDCFALAVPVGLSLDEMLAYARVARGHLRQLRWPEVEGITRKRQ